MELLASPLKKNEIADLKDKYGNYLKITADLEEGRLVVDCELHADEEKILLQNGNKQDNIWDGGIDLKNKEIDATAVMNIRPRLNNNSMEILNSERRERFIELVKRFFAELWN